MQQYREAIELGRAGQYERALAYAAAAVALLPDLVAGRVLYAKMLWNCGLHKAAAAEFNRLVAANPSDEELLRAARFARDEVARRRRGILALCAVAGLSLLVVIRTAVPIRAQTMPSDASAAAQTRHVQPGGALHGATMAREQTVVNDRASDGKAARALALVSDHEQTEHDLLECLDTLRPGDGEELNHGIASLRQYADEMDRLADHVSRGGPDDLGRAQKLLNEADTARRDLDAAEAQHRVRMEAWERAMKRARDRVEEVHREGVGVL